MRENKLEHPGLLKQEIMFINIEFCSFYEDENHLALYHHTFILTNTIVEVTKHNKVKSPSALLPEDAMWNLENSLYYLRGGTLAKKNLAREQRWKHFSSSCHPPPSSLACLLQATLLKLMQGVHQI